MEEESGGGGSTGSEEDRAAELLDKLEFFCAGGEFTGFIQAFAMQHSSAFDDDGEPYIAPGGAGRVVDDVWLVQRSHGPFKHQP